VCDAGQGFPNLPIASRESYVPRGQGSGDRFPIDEDGFDQI
jgi:hypothetical protein